MERSFNKFKPEVETDILNRFKDIVSDEHTFLCGLHRGARAVVEHPDHKTPLSAVAEVGAEGADTFIFNDPDFCLGAVFGAILVATDGYTLNTERGSNV